MEYKVNSITTTSTSDAINEFLKNVGKPFEQITKEYPIEISFDLLLQKTASKLYNIFSKMYYEVLSDTDRLELLEYCLTIYSSVRRDVFAPFSALGLKIKNKEEALRFFVIHFIIFLAEREERRPIELIEKLCNNILAYSELYKFIVKPINIMSNISNTEQLFVRIDAYLANLKLEPLNKELLNGLLTHLIILDMCEEYIK